VLSSCRTDRPYHIAYLLSNIPALASSPQVLKRDNHQVGNAMPTVNTSSWRQWLLEANELAQRTKSSPTPVVLCWLAIEEYLAYFIHALETSASADLVGPYLTAKLVLPSLSSESDSVLSRYKVTAALFTGSPIDNGAQIWQEVDLLQKCRNAIVHPKPFVTERKSLKSHTIEEIEIHKHHRRLVKRLQAHVPDKLLDDNFELSITASFYVGLSSPIVSAWAQKCSLDFIGYIANLMPTSSGQNEFIRAIMLPHFKELGLN
jgi:hypothetical protein